jgi:hypothetical protein
MSDLEQLHKKAQKAITGVLEPDERVLVARVGEDSALVATNRRILICKWGLQTGAMFSTQLNSWDLRNIAGIETRKGMTTASIVVQSAGTVPVTKFGRMDKGAGSVWEAPNALFIKTIKTDKRTADDIAAELRRLVADAHGTGVTPQAMPVAAPDPADQIRKLAALRDEGLLSEEEFQAKKLQILGF